MKFEDKTKMVRVSAPVYDVATKKGRRLVYLAMADAFVGNLEPYATIRESERMRLRELRQHPVGVTIMRPIVSWLKENGISTGDLIGEVMDTLPEITPRQLHKMACSCHGGHEVSVASLAAHLRRIARPSLLERIGGLFGAQA